MLSFETSSRRLASRRRTFHLVEELLLLVDPRRGIVVPGRGMNEED
jgi:hypothetical protein